MTIKKRGGSYGIKGHNYTIIGLGASHESLPSKPNESLPELDDGFGLEGLLVRTTGRKDSMFVQLEPRGSADHGPIFCITPQNGKA
jgi:hypothetical protein